MRCKICDSLLNKPVWNAQLEDWEVCHTCLEIIQNVFEDSPDFDYLTDEEEVDEVEEEKVLDKPDNPVYNILMDGQG